MAIRIRLISKERMTRLSMIKKLVSSEQISLNSHMRIKYSRRIITKVELTHKTINSLCRTTPV